MNIKKPTKAELMAWLKDNSLDHGTYVFIPASKVADTPATSIGDLLKEWANKPVTPADYVFDPKTVTLADHWRKFALDFRADRDHLQKQVDESGASYRRTIDRAQTVIDEKADLIARLRGCLDKERDAYARLAKRLDRMREKFPRAMESIEDAIDEEAGE